MLRPVTAALLLNLLVVPAARADLDSARALLLKGDYAAALAAYQAEARGATLGEALLGQAECHGRVGRYADMEKLARRALGIPKVADAALAVLADVLIDTGRYAEAIKILEREVPKRPKALLAKALLGRAYDRSGNDLKSGVIWKELAGGWDAGTFDKTRGDHAYLTALGGLGERDWKYASEAFEEALKLDPKLHRANVDWGWLFMTKFAVPDAEKSFKDVLKFDANHADAWAGLAWVEWYDAQPNRQRGRKHAEKALSINPNCVEAMLYLAALDVYDSEFGRAIIWLDRALKVNPGSIRALGFLGALHFIREKTADFEAVKKRALTVNPRGAEFYQIVGKAADRHHLYREAVALLKEAKNLDANSSDVLGALGIALLRTGDEAEGLFWLKESWKIDRFNHQVKNLLDLYDDVAKKTVTVKIGHFTIRMPRSEEKLLRRYVPQLLEKALAEYRVKYGFTPKGSTMVELYEKHEEFTVRTFGEPVHGGILGVCFGPVITSTSPSLGKANWAMVLWHEFAHTMHIEASRSRVHRWFTEGLAEYETIRARPEWRREHRLDLWRAVQEDVVTGIDDLNGSFSNAKSMKGIVLAYFQSSQVIAFIGERWGYPAFRQALALYGQNRTTPEVIREITGLASPQFDAAFSAWVKQQYAHLGKNFDPLQATVVPFEKLQARAQKAPGSARAQANLALGLFGAGQRAEALAAVQKALTLDPKDPVARFLQAEKARSEKKTADARAIYEGLIKEGRDGFLIRMRLAAMDQEAKRLAGALDHYAAAKRLEPDQTGPYDARIRILASQKNEMAVLEEMAGLAELQEGDGSLLYSIVTRGAKLNRWDLVRRYGSRALEVQPYNLVLHEKYAWALKAGGKHAEAVFEFESALLAIPETMPPAAREKLKETEFWIYLGMAEAAAAMRDREKALSAVLAAYQRKPNDARVIALRKRLDPGYRPGE
jgi:tetratricopeptide (TPR) repeat protein